MNIETLAILLAIAGWVVAIQQTRKALGATRALRSAQTQRWTLTRNIASLRVKAEERKKKLATLMRDMDVLRSLAESAGQAVVEIERERDAQAKLAQERFELIEGIVQEKEIVWRMYRDSTRQAGVAQNWLLREYSSALQALNHYRRQAGQPEVSAPAQLTALVAEFAAVAKGIPDLPASDAVPPAPPAPGPETRP